MYGFSRDKCVCVCVQVRTGVGRAFGQRQVGPRSPAARLEGLAAALTVWPTGVVLTHTPQRCIT